jgi:hypothetical protein
MVDHSINTIITIVGSFIIAILMYYIREWIQKQRLRRAIRTELQTTTHLDETIEREGVPANDFHPTAVLEANIERLGYFDGDMIESLVNYLSSSNRMKDAIEIYRTPGEDFDDKPENINQIVQGEAQVTRYYRNKILSSWIRNPEKVFDNPDEKLRQLRVKDSVPTEVLDNSD